jgi:hypothetical protein
MDSARHVIGCQSTQEPRICNMFDDVASTVIAYQTTQQPRVRNMCDDLASTIHQSLPTGAPARSQRCTRSRRLGTEEQCSPRHRMPIELKKRGFTMRVMTWRGLSMRPCRRRAPARSRASGRGTRTRCQGLTHITRHVIGRHVTQEREGLIDIARLPTHFALWLLELHANL